MDIEFIKGFAAFAAMMIVFVGSIWLLLAMILGARLGYFVMASCFFGVMMLLSAIWAVTGLGPKGDDGFLGDLGQETAWHPAAAGPALSTEKSEYGTFNVSDYPDGESWKKPSKTGYLADLQGEANTGTELNNARPAMEALLLDAVSEIPGKRKEAEEHVKGEINLKPEEFKISEVMMKEATVKGKNSVIALGKGVPSAVLTAGALNGEEEGEVSKYLVKLNDSVTVGTPIMQVKTKSGATVDLVADKAGKVILFGFKIGDKVKPNVPFATVDISGQPGAPEPAQVLAARVRGSEKMPALIYLLVSSGFFVLHLLGLSRAEKSQKAVPQTA